MKFVALLVSLQVAEDSAQARAGLRLLGFPGDPGLGSLPLPRDLALALAPTLGELVDILVEPSDQASASVEEIGLSPAEVAAARADLEVARSESPGSEPLRRTLIRFGALLDALERTQARPAGPSNPPVPAGPAQAEVASSKPPSRPSAAATASAARAQRSGWRRNLPGTV